MGTILKQEVAEYLKGENQIDTPANTQLFEAASAGNIQQLKAALEEGANSNYVSKEGDMVQYGCFSQCSVVLENILTLLLLPIIFSAIHVTRSSKKPQLKRWIGFVRKRVSRKGSQSKLCSYLK